jgi:hypothetical protein
MRSIPIDSSGFLFQDYPAVADIVSHCIRLFLEPCFVNVFHDSQILTNPNTFVCEINSLRAVPCMQLFEDILYMLMHRRFRDT